MRKKLVVTLMATLMLVMQTSQNYVAKAEVLEYKSSASEDAAVTTEVTELTPNLVVKEADLSKEEGYYEVKFPDEEEVMVMPINISDKGGLFITLGEDNTNYYSLDVNLYSDEACTKKVGSTVYLFSGDVTKTKNITIDKSGLYYMQFNLSKKSDTGTISFLMQLALVSAEDQTLTQDEINFSYQDYDKPDTTYKIVVEATGLVTLTLGTDYEYGFSGKVQLLDKDKKALSTATSVYASKNDEGEYNDVQRFYAVNKGTYYVKVDTGNGMYGIQYGFSEVKDASGAEKAKAKAIKLGGSAVKGMCATSDATSKTDWYSIKLTNDKKIVITVNSKVDGKLKFEILDSKGRTLWYGSRTIYDGEDEMVLESDGKFSKGTYYIKISKYDKTSSGYYTIKVK